MNQGQLGIHFFINLVFVVVSAISPQEYGKFIVTAQIGYNMGSLIMVALEN